MNPEFQRNLWLEFSARRAIFMAVALGLVFLLGNSTGSNFLLRNSAEYIFYGIVVLWGSRNAAQAVVGEIRERTWDSQRLSSLTPFEMTWGKLFGATSYTWFGGAICLAVLIPQACSDDGPAQAIADLCYFLSIGLMAHAVAFFSSLLSVRRRQTHSRLDVFVYQLAGLGAACGVWWVWKIISSGGLLSATLDIQFVHWWGTSIGTSVFFIVSLFLFLVWALIGCHRLMRLELSMQNTPIVWAGFLVFMVVYFAGQGGTAGIHLLGIEISGVVGPLAIAMFTAAGLTYAAAFAEPKDRVLYRWLIEAAMAKRNRFILPRLQAWMVSYIATVIFGFVLAFVLVVSPPQFLGRDFEYGLFDSGAVVSGLGFLTRDIAIILLYALSPNARRGELPAVVTLVLLYFVAPGLTGLHILFYPFAAGEGVVGPIIGWAEAILAWFFVYQRARKTVFGLDASVLAQPERK